MNKLNGRDSQSKEIYLKFYLASIEESYKLLKEAELLFENKSFERAYFLGFAALEEISNGCRCIHWIYRREYIQKSL